MSIEHTPLRIATVQAGLGVPSTTARLATTLEEALLDEAHAAGLEPSLTRVNVREIATAVTEATVTGFASETVESALAAVREADLLIAVTPTFNASYSGLFKAFFDLFDAEAIASTPVILGATGGTARHSLVIDMAMRPLFSFLRAIPVPTSVFVASEDFSSPGGAGSISARATRVADEALALVGTRNGQARNAQSPTRGNTTENGGWEGSTQGHADGGSANVGPHTPEVLHSPAGDFTPFDRIAKKLSSNETER